MSDANPYRAPSAEIADIPEHGDFELAGVGHRFGALCIDGGILALVVLPVAYATGTLDFVMDSEDGYGGAAAISALLFALFIVTQSYFLKKSGQTIGKKIVGIRMVDRDGKLPGLRRLLYRRYLPLGLYNALPVAGFVLAVIDFLLVFRRDRRCLHDMLAGTRVVIHNARHSSISWLIASIFILVVVRFAIASIEPLLDRPPPKPTHVHKTAAPAAAPAAAKLQPGAPKPPVETAAAHGSPSASPDPSGRTAAGHPVHSGPAHPAPATPAAETPAATQPSVTTLRKCATLGDAAAIIRCSQNDH